MIIHQNDNSKSNYNYNLVHYTDIRFVSHFHRNLELIYVKEGEITISIYEKDEHLRAGDYALVFPYQIHSYETPKRSECFIAVFSGEFVPKFANMILKKQGESVKFSLSDDTHKFIQNKLLENESSVMMKKACFYAACDEYLSQTKLYEKKSNDIKVGNILDFIAENYTENLTLETVADRFGYEYHYLSRLLNKHYHINFRELINEYRVEAAKEMLLIGDKKITDIALECGFQSIRSFNYVFKQITGQTPKGYIN